MNELSPRPFLVLPVEHRSVGAPSDRRLVLSGGRRGSDDAWTHSLCPTLKGFLPGSEVGTQARAQRSQHGLQFWIPRYQLCDFRQVTQPLCTLASWCIMPA